MPTNILTQIREDMTVIDSTGDKIGTVETVQFGDEDPHNAGVETVTSKRPPMQDDTLVDYLAEAFRMNDRLAEEMRARLNRYGYIKVKRGIPGLGHYVIGADQIETVQADQVKLQKPSDELLTVS